MGFVRIVLPSGGEARGMTCVQRKTCHVLKQREFWMIFSSYSVLNVHSRINFIHLAFLCDFVRLK
jgi:hypothetical protein